METNKRLEELFLDGSDGKIKEYTTKKIKIKTKNDMIFNSKIPKKVFELNVFYNLNNFYVMKRSNSKTGVDFNTIFNPLYIEILEISLITEDIQKSSDEFKSFEDFKKMFDLTFITEEHIKTLWESKSSQHGEKYNKKDFKPYSEKGKQTLNRFLTMFKNVNEITDKYSMSSISKAKVLNVRDTAYSNRGRDISIEHKEGLPYVWYSSEFAGCLNGSYFIIASKTKVLHMEDD